MKKPYKRGRKTSAVFLFLETGLGQCVFYAIFTGATIVALYAGVPA